MTSTLERDLQRRTYERFHLWLRDTVSLYEMAGLKPVLAEQYVTALLLKEGATLAAKTDASPMGVAQAVMGLVQNERNKIRDGASNVERVNKTD